MWVVVGVGSMRVWGGVCTGGVCGCVSRYVCDESCNRYILRGYPVTSWEGEGIPIHLAQP